MKFQMLTRVMRAGSTAHTGQSIVSITAYLCALSIGVAGVGWTTAVYADAPQPLVKQDKDYCFRMLGQEVCLNNASDENKQLVMALIQYDQFNQLKMLNDTLISVHSSIKELKNSLDAFVTASNTKISDAQKAAIQSHGNLVSDINKLLSEIKIVADPSNVAVNGALKDLQDRVSKLEEGKK